MTEVNVRSNAVKEMRSDKEFVRARDYLEDHPEARLGKAATTARSRVNKIRKKVRELEGLKLPPKERIDRLEGQMRAIQETFINRVERTRDRRE